MNWLNIIENAYQSANEGSENLWRNNPTIGTIRTEPFYHPTQLAMTTGTKPEANTNILQLLGEINQLVDGDPLGDVMTPETLHATFLAIGTPDYDEQGEIVHFSALSKIHSACCAGHIFKVSNLQLIALPNQLLLAGYPDQELLIKRGNFAAQILRSPWKKIITERYHGGPIPPVFWHSTILRYSADFLPERIRRYYFQHKCQNYGEVSGEIRLLLSSYNWGEVSYLD